MTTPDDKIPEDDLLYEIQTKITEHETKAKIHTEKARRWRALGELARGNLPVTAEPEDGATVELCRRTIARFLYSNGGLWTQQAIANATGLRRDLVDEALRSSWFVPRPLAATPVYELTGLGRKAVEALS